MALELLIAGGYLAIIIYALLLDNDSFRDYMTAFAETIIKIFHIKNTHPYTIMQMFGVVLLLCSWIGLLLLGLLIFDYIKYKNKQKK
jgi:hypothetical protein